MSNRSEPCVKCHEYRTFDVILKDCQIISSGGDWRKNISCLDCVEKGLTQLTGCYDDKMEFLNKAAEKELAHTD